MPWTVPTRWRTARKAPVTHAIVAFQASGGDSLRSIAFARADRLRGVVRLGRSEPAGIEALRADGLLRDARSVLVLDAAQRQIVMLDAPAVDESEWSQALRFPVAKALGSEPDDVLFDHARVPVLAEAGRPQVMIAAARLGPVRALLDQLAERGLRPDAVDVVDMAQRNLVLTAADDTRPGATVVIGAAGRELMVGLVADGDLCVARNLALPTSFAADRHDEAVSERLVLHVQRTVDLFERQITRFAIGSARLVSEDFAPATLAALQSGLSIPTRLVGLADLASGVPVPAGVERGTLLRLAATARMRAEAGTGVGRPAPVATAARATEPAGAAA
jgi:hypothetical protein